MHQFLHILLLLSRSSPFLSPSPSPSPAYIPQPATGCCCFYKLRSCCCTYCLLLFVWYLSISCCASPLHKLCFLLILHVLVFFLLHKCRSRADVQAEIREGYDEKKMMELQEHWLKIIAGVREKRRGLKAYNVLQVRYADCWHKIELNTLISIMKPHM